MVEKIILDYLAGKLNVPVFLEVPASIPKTFVVLDKIGSDKTNQIKSCTIAIQSYDETLYKTALLNEQIKVLMEQIVELDVIAKSKLNSDYNFTDTSTKRYRYQAIYDLIYY